MNQFDDLKSLWHSANTTVLPTSDEMLNIVRNFRNQKLRNKKLMIAASLLLSFLFLLMLVIIHFELVTTYVGGVLVIISGLVLAISNIKSIKRFNNLTDISNIEFIAFIEQTRKNQVYYYKHTMVVTVVLCTVGWMLYMYEVVQHKPEVLIIVYSLFLIYISYMWFFVRPRSFKKNADKLNQIKENVSKITIQLQQ